MSDHLQSFIQDLRQRKQGLFTDDDFKECQEAATDIGEMIRKLEATETKFRRKLSDTASEHPPDKEKIIYLQGMVDGMNLTIKPLENHYRGTIQPT
ncbi:MAG: hypothetical protein K0S39_2166 [Paenibacillus sp.]|nr:hypothetical protein [Paenibacillus sp.]